MADKKYEQSSRLIQTTSILSCTVTKPNCTSKIMKLFWSWQNTSHVWQNEFIYSVTLTYFLSGALYWRIQLSISKTKSVTNGCSLSIVHFFIVSGIKIVFWTQNCSQKPISRCIFLLVILDFLQERWTNNINLVEPLVMVTRTWSSYLVILKYSDYMQYYMMLLEQ